MPAYSLFLCAAALAAPGAIAFPDGEPKLAVMLAPNTVEFAISAANVDFLGIVIGSLDGNLVHYFAGLPPLLDNHVILTFGLGGPDGMVAKLPESLFPAGIPIYAQGVVLDAAGITSSNVASFVLDVTVP